MLNLSFQSAAISAWGRFCQLAADSTDPPGSTAAQLPLQRDSLAPRPQMTTTIQCRGAFGRSPRGCLVYSCAPLAAATGTTMTGTVVLLNTRYAMDPGRGANAP